MVDGLIGEPPASPGFRIFSDGPALLLDSSPDGDLVKEPEIAMASVLQQYFGSSKLTDSPVDQATKPSPKPTAPAKDIASKWLEQFNHAITSRDAEAVANLFQDDGMQLKYHF